MSAPRNPEPSPFARLRMLLEDRHPRVGLFARATTAALAEARALGPELAAEGVAAVLAAYEAGRDAASGERAADLAFELRLVGAIPTLVACLERLPDDDTVAYAALRALVRMRAEASAPLLAAFDRSTTAGARARMGCALMRVAVPDERVRAAFVTLLADDPVNGAGYLAEHGDPGALPHLSATLDRLELADGGVDGLRRCEEVVAVAQAIRALDGALTGPQREKVDQAWARGEDLLRRGLRVQEPVISSPGGEAPTVDELVQKFARDPVEARDGVAQRGDRSVAPALSKALDQLLRAPVADCDICAAEQLAHLAEAIGALGGTVTEEQRFGIEEVCERAAKMWTFVDDDRSLGATEVRRSQSRRAARPSRNDPCHCGSGRKYKKCHLDADEAGVRH